MQGFLAELAKINPVVLGVFGAFFGMIGAIIAALITGVASKLVVTPFLGARDKQDREVEWRKHALELTKLDLDRKLRTRAANDTRPVRPSILDFLANYRDLQELGSVSPKELYLKIERDRITRAPDLPQATPAAGQPPTERPSEPKAT